MQSPEAAKNVDILIAAAKDLYRDCERKDWSPYELPKPLAVLWAVEQMSGVVGNGGLQYFFENDWPKKPPYTVFINGLKYVGAIEASEVLSRAVALFPFPEPHLNFAKRRDFMNECEARDGKYKTEFDHLTTRLYELEDDLNAKLGAHIRANLVHFPSARPLLTD